MSKSKHSSDFPRSNIVKKKKTTGEGSESRLQTPALTRKKQVKQKTAFYVQIHVFRYFILTSPLTKLKISSSNFNQRFASKFCQVKIVIIFSVGHG